MTTVNSIGHMNNLLTILFKFIPYFAEIKFQNFNHALGLMISRNRSITRNSEQNKEQKTISLCLSFIFDCSP